MSTRDRRPSLAASTPSLRLVLLLAAAPQMLAAQEPPPDTTVREAVTVTEARAIAAFPDLSARRAAQLVPADLVVVEDGITRQVTRIERIDPQAGAPWTVLAYFDLALSEPDTPQLVAFRLGELSQLVADLGPVHPIVARADAVERLPVARNAGELEHAMATLSKERGTDSFDRMRLSFRPRDVRSGRALLEESQLLRRRADLLVAEAARLCAEPPCLLFLVSDGFDLRTDLFHPRHAAEASGAEQPAAIAEEVGRVLAGLGFVVISLPLRAPEVIEAETRQRLREQRGAGTDYDDWRDHVATARDGTATSSNRPEPDPKRTRTDRAYDALILPELEPLRLWAVASSGNVLRLPEQIEPAIEELRERWFVYFRTERAAEGELRPLEMRFATRGPFQRRRRVGEALGLVADEAPLRHQRWIRSATPPEVSAARLRRVAAGARFEDAVYAAREQQDGETRLLLATPDGKRRVRLTRLDEEGAVHHRVVDAVASDGRVAVPLREEEASGGLLAVDLGTGIWGAVAEP